MSVRRHILSILFATVLLFFFAFAHPILVAAKTVSLVFEIVPGIPVQPLQWTTPPPIREELPYATPDGAPPGAVFRPAGTGRHGAVIFFLGVAPDLEDPDFNRVVSAIAQAGVVVLVHRSPDMEAVDVSPRVVEGLVAAYEALARQPYVDAERVGFAGFSVGASMALLAASDARIRDRVAMVNAFGGYSDVVDAVEAAVTHRVSYDAVEEEWTPQDLAVDILRRGVISMLSSVEDREALRAILREGQMPGQSSLDTLTEEGRAVYALLTSGTGEEFSAAFARLPDVMKERLRAISPGVSIREIRTKVYLMHDRSDRFIPYVESRRLRDTLGPMTEVTHTEFSIFKHVNPAGVELSWDFFSGIGKLFWHLYRVLLNVA